MRRDVVQKSPARNKRWKRYSSLRDRGRATARDRGRGRAAGAVPCAGRPIDARDDAERIITAKHRRKHRDQRADVARGSAIQGRARLALPEEVLSNVPAAWHSAAKHQALRLALVYAVAASVLAFRLIPLAPALPTCGDERAIGARLHPATDKMLIAPEATA